MGERGWLARPGGVPAAGVAVVKSMACEPPEDRRVPQSRWSAADLAAEAQAEGLVESVARSTVWRGLGEGAIRAGRDPAGVFSPRPGPPTRHGRRRPRALWSPAAAEAPAAGV